MIYQYVIDGKMVDDDIYHFCGLCGLWISNMFNLPIFWAKVLMAAPQLRGSPRHVISAPREELPPSGPRNVTGSWIHGFLANPQIEKSK
jgi:hypothetical protein